MTDSSIPHDGSDDAETARATELTYAIGEDERPSEAVVRATARLTDTSPLDLEPLYDVVDPDQLDGLFAESGDRAIPDERSVTITFNGCRVSVTGDEVFVRLDE